MSEKPTINSLLPAALIKERIKMIIRKITGESS